MDADEPDNMDLPDIVNAGKTGARVVAVVDKLVDSGWMH